jgi:serine/threonine protein kinase
LKTKLIDFGSANYIPIQKQDFFRNFTGTALYTPPEILRGESFQGPQVDVWCLGIVLYILSFNYPPFKTMNDISMLKFRKPDSVPSAGLWSLLRRILTLDPQQRPTCAEILKDEWIV